MKFKCSFFLVLYTSCVCVVPAQELDDNLSGLTHEFEQATAAKLKCQQQAESTANTISLANRYIAHAVSKLKSSSPMDVTM